MATAATPVIRTALEDERWQLARDFLLNFTVTVILFAVAIALTFLEDWCVYSKRPDYLCFAIKTISIALLLIDGITLICICAITAVSLVSKYSQKHLKGLRTPNVDESL